MVKISFWEHVLHVHVRKEHQSIHAGHVTLCIGVDKDVRRAIGGHVELHVLISALAM